MFDDEPRLGEVVDRARRQHLHRNVAKGRRLHWARDDAAACRVGGELIQQSVAGTAADDLDFGNRPSRQLLERVDDDAVFEREAFENRARKRRWSRGLLLVGAHAVRDNRPLHAVRVQKGWIVRVEQ